MAGLVRPDFSVGNLEQTLLSDASSRDRYAILFWDGADRIAVDSQSAHGDVRGID